MIDRFFCEICGKELREYSEFEICDVCKSKCNLLKNRNRLKEINELLLKLNKEKQRVIAEMKLALK